MSPRGIGFAFLAIGLAATFSFSQTKKAAAGSLVGAWKVVEITSPNGEKNTNPQPGLYIFTQKHYSIMLVTGTKPRPKYEAANKATDADKIATFDAFTANSGTYTISGNVLKTRPLVAKNEFVMSGPEQESEVKIDGNTLLLTAKGGPAPGGVTKLMRVE